MSSRSKLFERLSLPQLELVALVTPIVFLAILYVLVLSPIHPIFHRLPGIVLLTLVVVGSVWAFTRAVFGAVRALQGEVETLSAQTQRHNQQLMLLHGADLALMRETRVEEALLRIVELGAQLSDACHAVLVLGDATEDHRVLVYPEPESERPPCCALESAVRNGADPATVDRDDGRTLALQLSHLGTSIGSLYLGRNLALQPFAAIEQEVGRMFATHAAMVVENARLYDEVRTLAIESERHALAREMHDSLAQVLAFVNTKAQAVELYLRGNEVTAARQQMAELSAAAREVYADIREGIGALRADVAGRTLEELISGYAEEFGHTSGLRVTLDWDVAGDALQMSPSAEVQVLRIVQEALINVRRHAAAEEVKIHAALIDDVLALGIADDGRGFSPAARLSDGRPRFGLQTMTERANALGGSLSIDSAPGRGTTIRVRIPVPASALIHEVH